jgi:hypothetical protein
MTRNYEIGESFQEGIIKKINQQEKYLVIVAKEDFQQDFRLDENGWNQPFYKHSVYGLGEDKSWRFPELDELSSMYNLKSIIGGFKNDFYWSSSLAEDNVSLEYKMFNGLQWQLEQA